MAGVEIKRTGAIITINISIFSLSPRRLGLPEGTLKTLVIMICLGTAMCGGGNGGGGSYAETGCGTATDCNDGNDIPSGCFDMGDSFDEGQSDELPVHRVCVTSGFNLDVHPVTNAEYRACVDAAGCAPPGYSSSYSRASYYGNSTYDNFPVIYVDWNQATTYCAWAGKRLPTEAEWEYAARGGLSGKRYPRGDTINGADANYWGSGDPWDNDTSEAQYYAPNGYGLYDMGGNVWEWVNDRYSSTYYSLSPTNDPPGPDTGSSHIVRGGGWSVDPNCLRVSKRLNYYPEQMGSLLGFRCARD